MQMLREIIPDCITAGVTMTSATCQTKHVIYGCGHKTTVQQLMQNSPLVLLHKLNLLHCPDCLDESGQQWNLF